jgi:hypothetical protein
VRWLVAISLAIGCHNDPPPAAPVPVSSTGTPLGFLIDDGQLHLSTEQLAELRGLDANLTSQLDPLDKRAQPPGSAAAPAPALPVRRGRRAGPNAGSADRAADERMAEVRAALAQVFAVLDDGQRARARQVLSDHDIDLDVEDPAPVPPPVPPPVPAHEPAQPSPPAIPPPSQVDSH